MSASRFNFIFLMKCGNDLPVSRPKRIHLFTPDVHGAREKHGCAHSRWPMDGSIGIHSDFTCIGPDLLDTGVSVSLPFSIVFYYKANIERGVAGMDGCARDLRVNAKSGPTHGLQELNDGELELNDIVERHGCETGLGELGHAHSEAEIAHRLPGLLRNSPYRE